MQNKRRVWSGHNESTVRFLFTRFRSGNFYLTNEFRDLLVKPIHANNGGYSNILRFLALNQENKKKYAQKRGNMYTNYSKYNEGRLHCLIYRWCIREGVLECRLFVMKKLFLMIIPTINIVRGWTPATNPKSYISNTKNYPSQTSCKFASNCFSVNIFFLVRILLHSTAMSYIIIPIITQRLIT